VSDNHTGITEQQIKDVCTSFSHDAITQDLTKSTWLKAIEINGNDVELSVQMGFPCNGIGDDVAADLAQFIQSKLPVEQIAVNLNWQVKSHKVESGVAPITGIKNIIAVASGKGGVGKSTTSVNLALALQAEGASVGILDADIYGPSQPMMLGVADQQPESKDKKTIEPVEAHGLKSMSIGYLIDEDQAMVWRGPMVSSALQQLLNDTNWGELDYLIIDLPPGTGDIQLTLAQKVPVTAALIVTTPQDIALLDARKAMVMFEKVKIPSLGVVENMAVHICSACGNVEQIFGAGGGQLLAEKYGLDCLGALPLDIKIREQTDAGQPPVVTDPVSYVSLQYRDIARKLAGKLANEPVDPRGAGQTILFKEA
jgi:ATP-binding protein involved in chromosome partitioning